MVRSLSTASAYVPAVCRSAHIPVAAIAITSSAASANPVVMRRLIVQVTSSSSSLGNLSRRSRASGAEHGIRIQYQYCVVGYSTYESARGCLLGGQRAHRRVVQLDHLRCCISQDPEWLAAAVDDDHAAEVGHAARAHAELIPQVDDREHQAAPVCDAEQR